MKLCLCDETAAIDLEESLLSIVSLGCDLCEYRTVLPHLYDHNGVGGSRLLPDRCSKWHSIMYRQYSFSMEVKGVDDISCLATLTGAIDLNRSFYQPSMFEHCMDTRVSLGSNQGRLPGSYESVGRRRQH